MTLDDIQSAAVCMVIVGLIWFIGYGVGHADGSREERERGHTG